MIILRFCGDILPRRAVLSSSSISEGDLDKNVPSLTERYVTDVKCCRALSSASANGVSIRQLCMRQATRPRFDCGDNSSRYYPPSGNASGSSICIRDLHEKVPSLTERHVRSRKVSVALRFRGAGVLIAWIIIRRWCDITHRRAVLGSSSISVRDLGDIVPLCAERHVRRRKVLLGANGRTGALVVGIIRRCGDNTSRRAMLMVAASAYEISMRKSRRALSAPPQT